MVDLVILVYVDEEIQIQRLMNRDGLTKADALERIRVQMPIEEKKKYADYIVDTSISQEDAEKQVGYIFKRLRALSLKGKNALN